MGSTVRRIEVYTDLLKRKSVAKKKQIKISPIKGKWWLFNAPQFEFTP